MFSKSKEYEGITDEQLQKEIDDLKKLDIFSVHDITRWSDRRKEFFKGFISGSFITSAIGYGMNACLKGVHSVVPDVITNDTAAYAFASVSVAVSIGNAIILPDFAPNPLFPRPAAKRLGVASPFVATAFAMAAAIGLSSPTVVPALTYESNKVLKVVTTEVANYQIPQAIKISQNHPVGMSQQIPGTP